MLLTCATFNVLADTYLAEVHERLGVYDYVPAELREPKARIQPLVELISSLQADVIGLQEVETDLFAALKQTGMWQLFWTPKQGDAPDGCLMLVRRGIEVSDFTIHAFTDQSGHVMQSAVIGDTLFVNTHVKWATAITRAEHHAGVMQTKELLAKVGDAQSVVILADCNDRPGGPVRALIERSGFNIVSGDMPTAYVNWQPAALDLIATRGVTGAELVSTGLSVRSIPDGACPSDHIPVMAWVEAS